MRIAILDGDVSYPPTSGKRLRTLNLMLRLADRHRITYLARGDARTQDFPAAERYLRDRGLAPILLDAPIARKKGPGFYLRLAANLFSSEPYSVTSHRCPTMRAAAEKLLLEGPIDVWQVEWSAYLPVVDGLPGTKLLVAHNVDALIWQRYFENETRPLHRFYIRRQWAKFERFEGNAYRRADRVVACTEADAALIRERFGQPNVDVVDNGIDRAFFEQARGTRDPHAILFLGALDWRPNLDGVNLLLDRIFPAVRALIPQARLRIVGRHPSPALVQRCAGAAGVELHADVPDVRPFLAEAGVLAVPLRIGGGSRLKILEALACGLPVVSTRVGAEGLNLVPGEHFVQAEEDAMAAALVDILQAPEKAIDQARRGRDLVRQTYDWGVLADLLERSWQRCLDGKRP